jgi:hypothetical protein
MKEIRHALGAVIVELTRRCNMKCRHCMRGPAQCRDMKPEVMGALVEKMAGISVDRIALGGGESTVVPELVSKFFDATLDAGIYPGSYSIVTNGKAMPTGFMNVIARIQAYAEVYVMASFDNCHDRISRDEFIERCEELKRVTSEADRFHEGVTMQFRYRGDNFLNDEIKEERHTSEDVLRMGRGATAFGGYKAVTVYPYDVKGDGDDYLPLCECDFYVDVDGNVWPHCDLSYRFMSRRKKYCLGNVTDPGFDWYEAAVRFNLKFAEKFPLKLMEPGHEEYLPSNSYDFRQSSTREKIEETIEIAKELNIKIKGGTIS